MQAVLIVEYDLPTLELYRRELSRDYEILTCSNAKQAFALLQTKRISAVVLEPFPHAEQGWFLLAAIRNLSDSPVVPVVICSSLDERQRGLEMGAAAYLVKPVLPATLLEALHHVVSQNDSSGDFIIHPMKENLPHD